MAPESIRALQESEKTGKENAVYNYSENFRKGNGYFPYQAVYLSARGLSLSIFPILNSEWFAIHSLVPFLLLA
jgi:hypothetical protein